MRMWELLADGEWHDYHTIIDLAGREVPPGKAQRVAEQIRVIRRGAPTQRVRQRERDRLILFGQRNLARETTRLKWFEVDPPGRLAMGQRKRIRRRPPPDTEGRDQE